MSYSSWYKCPRGLGSAFANTVQSGLSVTTSYFFQISTGV
jgi:hypothetical protein